ncbi:PREDICTED: cell cycle progression protein 1 [Cyprinodon variegatus]|uniref:Cell cycle progression 1 n=1 Tax=Cyprinodon variegatus TaxID=28743 RepID=A0A3Q2CQ61_CYPVA|nr:PREDICTED: cell cycle progression protein 1 [Cyprinodon variegatus]
MSDTSSDAESSCGWTIISNEGSDIETLGSDAAAEYATELSEQPSLEEPQLIESQASSPAALGVKEISLDDTLGEQTVDETMCGLEAGNDATVKEHVFSSSDHSDIVTLRDLSEGQHGEEEAASSEELYLGTSSSSHYTFTATETAFPAQQPALTNSSSSEDEDARSSSPILRKRRVRKNTTSIVTDPEEEEVLQDSLFSELEKKEELQQQADWVEVRPNAAHDDREQGLDGNILNKCILLALIIAVSMGFGHFYGTVQIQERQKTSGIEHMDVRDLLKQHDGDWHLTQQVQRDSLEKVLKQTMEESTDVVSQQQRLTDENLQLRSSLEREEKSLSVLQEELKNLRSKIQDLEARGVDSLLSENQRLKEQLEEGQWMIRDFQVQRKDMMAEAHMLRMKLDRERKVTEELRNELSALRSHVSTSNKESGSEAEDWEQRLLELQKKLSFEQQRSDLWERLYVESKEEKAKGDRESKVKRTRQGMAGKMKETFDAVKNSTKDFVHHHKEQIKKAKEAVKENLRKFSDSVKSTFKHFKDSASTFINKAQRFYNKKHDKANTDESWQRPAQKPHHRHKTSSSHNDNNTRKSAGKVLQDQESNQRRSMKGCSGVFDCAYQESTSLFNKATEPIRADEFNLLLQSYLQQEVDHFYHWNELGAFINGFFHNGLFIHDRMLFTDFVSKVESYLADIQEYHGLDDDMFRDLDDYIYRHFFGEGYTKSSGPRGPFPRPDTDSKEDWRARHQQRKQPRGRSRPHCSRKMSRSGRNADRHMADVKIELGPMPFDPKY